MYENNKIRKTNTITKSMAKNDKYDEEEYAIHKNTKKARKTVNEADLLIGMINAPTFAFLYIRRRAFSLFQVIL